MRSFVESTVGGGVIFGGTLLVAFVVLVGGADFVAGRIRKRKG